MATFIKRKKSSKINAWPAIFNAPVSLDTLATQKLWQTFYRDRDSATLNALVEHYAPLARMIAAMLKKRNPDFYRDDIDELVSDAAFGLVKGINLNTYSDPLSRVRIIQEIRRTMHRETLKRRFGISHRRAAAMNEVARIRTDLIQELGRMPTPGEMEEQLAAQITNGNVGIGVNPRIAAGGQGDEIALDDAPSRELAPECRAMDAELIRLAKKNLHGPDLKILKLLLSGHTPGEIAKTMQLSRDQLKRRLNGVLWEARSRADLAKYLGVEPQAGPQLNRVIRQGALPPQAIAMGLSALPTVKLRRAERTDEQIIDLLRAGYSQRALRDATRGNTKRVRPRISALQRALIAEIRQQPAQRIAC